MLFIEPDKPAMPNNKNIIEDMYNPIKAPFIKEVFA
jgi:hypothetical protein